MLDNVLLPILRTLRMSFGTYMFQFDYNTLIPSKISIKDLKNVWIIRFNVLYFVFRTISGHTSCLPYTMLGSTCQYTIKYPYANIILAPTHKTNLKRHITVIPPRNQELSQFGLKLLRRVHSQSR